MSFTEKIDVLDLIINVLNEHEKKMDDIVQRLEIIVDILEGHPQFSEALTEYQQRTALIPGGSGSVLIVDDDEFLTESFRMLLQDAGFDVETASTGNQALLKASQTDFDLAILDLKLPDTTGSELGKRLKSRNKNLNVVLLTGHSEILDDMDPEDLGTDEVLFKPISAEELLKITEKLRSRA